VQILSDNDAFLTEVDGCLKYTCWSDQSNLESLQNEIDDVISCFCVHPNGNEVVVATSKFSLAHWLLESKECQKVIKAHQMPILCMDYDQSGTLVATGSSDRTVKVWDIEHGYCTHCFTIHTNIIRTVEFHQNGKKLWLFSTSEDNSIGVFDLEISKNIGHFQEHVSTPTSIAFSSKQNILISTGHDKVYIYISHLHETLHL
jgi:U3 small nucleolar RNA-associated protein 13